MPIDKNLFEEYVEARRKLDLVEDELFSRVREICEVCTNIAPCERITNIETEDEDPMYFDEPEVYVSVTSFDYGDESYHFPKRYLDMALDEIKADVERTKKLVEEEEQRAETDAEYEQYLKLKKKFENTETEQPWVIR